MKKEKQPRGPVEVLVTKSNGEEVLLVQHKKKLSWQTILFICIMIAPPLINWLVFYVYLNFQSFFMSFFQYKGSKGEIFFTMDNYRWVFEQLGSADSELIEAFRNTFITFGVGLIMWPVQIALSYFLYKKIAFYNGFRVLFYLPGLMNGIAVSQFTLALCGSRGPLVPLVVKWWGIEAGTLDSIFVDERFANLFINLHVVWMGFPGNLILWGGTLARIPDSLIEYGQLEGIGWVKEIYMIILPLVWPTFVLLFIMMWAGIFNAGGSVFLLTQGGQYGTQTLSNWMYMQVYGVQTQYSNYYNLLSAFGLMLSIVASAISLTARYLGNKMNKGVEY